MADEPDRCVRVAGVGCAVADYLYPRIDFTGAAFRRYESVAPADGGLEPGKLVFRDDFEAFAGVDLESAIRDMAGESQRPHFNVGGPALVAMVTAAQLLHGGAARVSFYGAAGDDETGRRIRRILADTPLDTHGYHIRPGLTPSTCVLSDPHHRDGHGERSFVNTIGAAGCSGREDLDDGFFEADLRAFGGTALVPPVHESLTALLAEGKAHGGVDVVHTVYDFRSEKSNPGARWSLGQNEHTYPLIDLLVMDAEEALRISGAADLAAACRHFIDGGVHALAVTDGVDPVSFYSDGSSFAPCPLAEMPVCEAVIRDRAAPEMLGRGDTTGCGDNFVGGMIACTAAQILSGREQGEWSLPFAVGVGVCTGGCACFHIGGLCPEREPGEKARTVSRYYGEYRRQVGSARRLPEWPF